MNHKVLIDGPKHTVFVDNYYIITCGLVRIDVQDSDISVQYVTHGWYLNADVNIDDLAKALLAAQTIIAAKQ